MSQGRGRRPGLPAAFIVGVDAIVINLGHALALVMRFGLEPPQARIDGMARLAVVTGGRRSTISSVDASKPAVVRLLVLLPGLVMMVSACGGDDEPAADVAPVGDVFPDVLEVTAVQAADGSWTFSATMSSPYDTPERYADAWRVVGPGGEVYGVRELAHDHAGEQPFTRSQSGIAIPEDVTTVTVEGRDQVSGWGGATIEVELGG